MNYFPRKELSEFEINECVDLKQRLINSMKEYQPETQVQLKVRDYCFDLVNRGIYDFDKEILDFLGSHYITAKMIFEGFGPILSKFTDNNTPKSKTINFGIGFYEDLKSKPLPKNPQSAYPPNLDIDTNSKKTLDDFFEEFGLVNIKSELLKELNPKLISKPGTLFERYSLISQCLSTENFYDYLNGIGDNLYDATKVLALMLKRDTNVLDSDLKIILNSKINVESLELSIFCFSGEKLKEELKKLK